MSRTLIPVMVGALVSTAGAAHAVVVSHTKFTNTQVAVFTSVETSVTCADQSEGIANATLFISGGSFGSSSGTSINVFGFFNSCTGQSIGFADGFIDGGVTGPNQPLTFAKLTGSKDLNVDNQTNVTVPALLDLTFTGNGRLSASRRTTQTRTTEGPGGPFTITVQRGAFRNRTADVTGTVTIAGVVFPVNLEFGATLLDNKSTTITITK